MNNLKQQIQDARASHIATYKDIILGRIIEWAGEGYSTMKVYPDSFNSGLSKEEKCEIISTMLQDNNIKYEYNDYNYGHFIITLVEE